MIGRVSKAGPVGLYDVDHPEYGRIRVKGISTESAINAALKEWGGSWKRDAGYCHAVWIGTALRPRCKRCHREYGQPGDPGAYCPECLEILDRQRREAGRYAAGHRARDRRLREEQG